MPHGSTFDLVYQLRQGSTAFRPSAARRDEAKKVDYMESMRLFRASAARCGAAACDRTRGRRYGAGAGMAQE